MKSLVLKDLYNIGRSAKSMFFTMLILAVAWIPTANVTGYIFMCAILCGTMIVTTFAFDDASKWIRYALITPVTPKDLVAGKFVVLSIFCAVGSLFGMVVGSICNVLLEKGDFDLDGIGQMLFLAMVAWAVALIFGGMEIPLVFKFGSERGRMLVWASLLVPVAICFGIYRLCLFLNIEMTDQFMFILLCCSPIAALLWCYGMYQISCRIFARKEV